MQDTLEVLEWSKIVTKMASFARTSRGKNACLSLKILPLEQLKKEMEFLRLAQLEIDLRGRFPLDTSSDLEHPLALARKGATLSIEEIEAVANDILTCISLQKHFALSINDGVLKQFVLALPELSALEKEIHKIIAPDLSIFDNASPALKHIRVSIARLEKEMVTKLGYVLEQNKSYLSDSTLTIRNGHYVLPVANAYKNKVKGIVQDISGSGGTTFIEPELLVQMNNKMAELRNDEREEIHRLLSELSLKIGGCADEVDTINKGIGYIDFLQAKVLYGEVYHAHFGTLSDDGSLFIPSAVHPLLDQAKVVPNDFSMSPGKKVVIISGPNAGGKTVALKTLAVSVMFFESGCLIPCKEGAIFPYFKNVYLDIGDSQSLSDNLSTFSGHMANIADICRRVGGKDLVLLDEVGTGTSPKEGESLAEAIVNFLIKKHCYCMISSHFEGLKAFAMSNPLVENASMLYDDVALLPTYRLKMGLPGESYGLKVAARFGIDPSIIADAEKSMGSIADFSVSKAIAKLASITKETEDLREKLAKEVSKAEAKERDLAIREKNLSLREEHYLSNVKQMKETMLYEAEKEIDAIISSLNSPEVKLHQAIAAKKKLEALKESQKESVFDTEVALGDYVKIPDYDVVGKVTSIKGNNLEIQTRDGFTFKVKKDRVIKTAEPEERKQAMQGAILDQVGHGTSIGLELNIIGLHVDEAMQEVMRYLDACRIKGFKRVRIIHGFGSGALRKATHEYLKKRKDFVESFELGGEYEGGSGATVVHLK